MNFELTMNYKLTHTWLIVAIALVSAQVFAHSSIGKQCTNKDHDISFFNQLKLNSYKNNEKFSDDELAIIFSNCLGAPDPKLRDGISYEGLVTLLRGERVSNRAKHLLIEKFHKILAVDKVDPKGFLKPFVALSLAEIARTDRVKAFLNQTQRMELVKVAASYVSSISDYRGFNKTEGWRHGVAHGADLLMQLSLNENLSKKEHWIILQAIATQATQSKHAFVFGEPARLARPVLFIAARNTLNDKQWQAFFNQVIKIKPLLNNWNDIYNTEKGLIKYHNTQAFLTTLYLNVSQTQNKNIKKILPHILEAIKSIP